MWRTKFGWQQRIIWGSEGGEADGAEVATEGLWEVAPTWIFMGFCIQRVQHLWGPWLSRLGSVLPAGAWRSWVTSGASGSSIFGGGHLQGWAVYYRLVVLLWVWATSVVSGFFILAHQVLGCCGSLFLTLAALSASRIWLAAVFGRASGRRLPSG